MSDSPNSKTQELAKIIRRLLNQLNSTTYKNYLKLRDQHKDPEKVQYFFAPCVEKAKQPEFEDFLSSRDPEKLNAEILALLEYMRVENKSSLAEILKAQEEKIKEAVKNTQKQDIAIQVQSYLDELRQETRAGLELVEEQHTNAKTGEPDSKVMEISNTTNQLEAHAKAADESVVGSKAAEKPQISDDVSNNATTAEDPDKNIDDNGEPLAPKPEVSSNENDHKQEKTTGSADALLAEVDNLPAKDLTDLDTLDADDIRAAQKMNARSANTILKPEERAVRHEPDMNENDFRVEQEMKDLLDAPITKASQDEDLPTLGPSDEEQNRQVKASDPVLQALEKAQKADSGHEEEGTDNDEQPSLPSHEEQDLDSSENLPEELEASSDETEEEENNEYRAEIEDPRFLTGWERLMHRFKGYSYQITFTDDEIEMVNAEDKKTIRALIKQAKKNRSWCIKPKNN